MTRLFSNTDVLSKHVGLRGYINKKVTMISGTLRLKSLGEVIVRPFAFIKGQLQLVVSLVKTITTMIFDHLVQGLMLKKEGWKNLGRGFVDVLDLTLCLAIVNPIYFLVKTIQNVAGALIHPAVNYKNYTQFEIMNLASRGVFVSS